MRRGPDEFPSLFLSPRRSSASRLGLETPLRQQRLYQQRPGTAGHAPLILRVQEKSLEGAVRGGHGHLGFGEASGGRGRGQGQGSRNQEQQALTGAN